MRLYLMTVNWKPAWLLYVWGVEEVCRISERLTESDCRYH